MIRAAEKVSAGDLSARVGGEAEANELGTLSRAFNRMTDQLAVQRDDLVEAHREEDTRRRFTEAVLGGVSAGVIGLDETGRINLPNRSAARLLNLDLRDLADQELATVLPEMTGLLASARRRPMRRRRGADRAIPRRQANHAALAHRGRSVGWNHHRFRRHVR